MFSVFECSIIKFLTAHLKSHKWYESCLERIEDNLIINLFVVNLIIGPDKQFIYISFISSYFVTPNIISSKHFNISSFDCVAIQSIFT